MIWFDTKAISYREDRADDGFGWDVRYDLSFLNSECLTTITIDLVGADPGSVATQWKSGINDIRNNKACFSDGSRLYEVKLQADFVDGGAHQTVTVMAGTGPTNMTTWFLEDPNGWPDDMHDEVAAHEAGHMFGLFDEYAGGATYDGYTTTGTMMSDLTLSGFERYFRTQEHYAEHYGGKSLSTVLARAGTAGNDVLNGTGGMDGFYGMAGNDTISGGSGNDLIDGGAGKDLMTGGGGRDIFDFDLSSETGTLFTTRDVITDFTRGSDVIDLSGMDASAVLSGPGDFHGFMWLGNAPQFVGAPRGELRYAWFDNAGTANDYTVVYGDTDLDLGSEFQIELRGLHSLSETDFYL